MYLRLGTTNIKYSTEQDDFTVFSEVVDSKMSYEKPILVRTPDELDIWFGSDFPGKDYYDELLESGVTLFLYRPIKVEQNTNAPDYVDLKEYSIDQKLYYNLLKNSSRFFNVRIAILISCRYFASKFLFPVKRLQSMWHIESKMCCFVSVNVGAKYNAFFRNCNFSFLFK